MEYFASYKVLSQDLQAELLLEHGVYLELVRNAPGLSIELYAVYDFYVEVYFDKTTEQPLLLRPFDSIAEPEPYLSLVEIESVFQTK